MSEPIIRPITPITGAVVEGIDLTTELDAAQAEQVKDLLTRHRVLVFHDQPMDDERHVALTDELGGATPAHPIVNGLPETPAVLRTELSADRQGLAEAEVGQLMSAQRPRRLHTEWHVDSTFVSNPTSVTILRGVQIPQAGGDTLFANLGALYDGLSPSLRDYLDTLQVIHHRHDPSAPERLDGRSTGPYAALHPLVVVHPRTGDKQLLVSTVFMQAIRGLKPRESHALLDFLLDELAGRDELHARVQWRPGTLVMWDNLAVAHAGPVDGLLFDDERIVHRTTVVGEPLQGPDGFVSRGLAGAPFEAIGVG